ncbi:hypothetical protein [Myxococcus sp. RHSTA-1-4]|uniref:hypothetical protein n=1 Tax=Myxococcus sp. RHSTA-1-4 TaxID=2874601 RepID=UPI001CBABEA1|nr:hypothetical protein [Myxococcus sp. RHSTA-1-4]MBZ4417579.1 hypothetical protein [Myxococcus sp. RHSTA-1-4]
MSGWVKAVGMVSSLGGLLPAAAAFRAGMAMPSAAPDFELFLKGDEEPSPVSVHAAGAATLGFSGVGRLVALLVEALVDLGAREDLRAPGAGVGLYLVLPDPEERGFTTSKEPDEEDPDAVSERVSLLVDRLVKGAWQGLGLPTWRGPVRAFHAGNVAFAQALAAAEEDLRNRKVETALLCAVDSLLPQETLQLLNQQRRLKTPGRPTGLMAGEAAVALVLTREPPAEPGVTVVRVAEGRDARPLDAEQPPDGQELTRQVLAALGPLAPDTPPPLLVSDHDGQYARAYEWGMLQVRLRDRDARFERCAVWMPAKGFGHTGVASGAVATALAFRALQRGYAPAPSILVLSSADAGERAVIHLAAARKRGA